MGERIIGPASRLTLDILPLEQQKARLKGQIFKKLDYFPAKVNKAIAEVENTIKNQHTQKN